MKKLQLGISFAFVFFFSQAFTPAKQVFTKDIIGIYWSPRKDAKIEIFLKGQYYFGKFIWLESLRKDINNPVKSLQSRDILGLEFLTKFECNGGVYTGGEIYDPETGKTYSCKMSLEGTKLKVRGYIGISLFGRTEYFECIK